MAKKRIRVLRTNNLANISQSDNLNFVPEKGQPFYDAQSKMLFIGDGNSKISDIKANYTKSINSDGAQRLINVNNSTGVVTNQSTTEGKLMYIGSDGKASDYNINGAADKNIGSITNPVYVANDGTVTASNATVGGMTGTAPNQTTYPIYLNNGEIKVLNTKLSNDISGNADTATLATNSINAIKKSDDSGYYGINGYMDGDLDFLYLNLNDQVDNSSVLWLPYLERMVSIVPTMELQDNASISFRSSKRFNFATWYKIFFRATDYQKAGHRTEQNCDICFLGSGDILIGRSSIIPFLIYHESLTKLTNFYFEITQEMTQTTSNGETGYLTTVTLKRVSGDSFPTGDIAVSITLDGIYKVHINWSLRKGQ